MSDPMCLRQSMMEMDMEGPYGEMDIEPGELDIEGPMAMHMLQKMGWHNVTNTHAPEITLNQHVLDAMQRRFGVNTTAGIQRMSANPEFQAFMYQVLTHSTPLSLAEFNANLSKAAVDRIMANIDSSAPNHRIAAGQLDHALLNTGGPAKDGASLTLDNNPVSNPWANMANTMAAMNPFAANPFAPMAPPTNTAGQTAPLVQNPAGTEGTEAAQPGTFQALVGGPLGEGGEGQEAGGAERGEAKETAEAGNKTSTGGKTETQTKGKGETQSAGLTGSQQHHAAVNQTAKQTGAKPVSNTNHTSSMAARLEATAQPKATTTHTANSNVQPLAGNQAKTQTQQPTRTQTQQQPIGTQLQPKPTATQNVQQPVATKEQDIVGKDSKTGMSKDQRTRLENANNKITPAPIPAGTVGNSNTNGKTAPGGSNSQTNVVGNTAGTNTQHTGGSNTPGNQAGSGPVVDPSKTGPTPTQTDHGVKTDPLQPGQGRAGSNIPTGIREAGLYPGITNNTVPVKAQTGYSSTGFAIAAGVLIALIVILGPIACMLWKMKEKHAERMRKQKAHKNRDMSENSILESMVLHDFGKGNTVANEAAEKSDYYTYGKGRYTSINADLGEVDELGANPESPRGRLP